MTGPDLEDRLRRALGPPDHQPPPDPAVLATIRDRAADHHDWWRPSAPGYRAVLVAAVAAGVVAMTWWAASRRPAGRGVELGPAQPGPAVVDLPGPPSWGWLVGVAVIGLALTVLTAHRARDRLLTAAVALLAAGTVVSTGVTLDALRHGAGLVARAPVIEGYELTGARLQYREEGRPPFRVATVSYRPAPGTATPPEEVTAREMLEPSWAVALGFDATYPNLGRRCLRQPPITTDRSPVEGDYYCLMEVVDGELRVAAATIGQDGTVDWTQQAGLPLAWLGLIVLVLARTDGAAAPRRRPAEQVRYGVALAASSLALYLSGQIAYDLVRVGSFGFAAECTLGNAGWPDCRDRIAVAIQQRGVTTSAYRLYEPFVMLMDLAAGLCLGLAWWSAGTLRRPSRRFYRFMYGHDRPPAEERSTADERRRRLLQAATLVSLVLIVAFQIAFRQRLGVLNDFNE